MGQIFDMQFTRDLSITSALWRPRRGFTPAALFRSGEVGAWFDASDLTTLFQDSVGTTPVTAAADPVGLWLDKSQGLALGAELLANGTFAADTTGWTPFTATFVAESGEGLLTVNVAGSYPTISSDAFTTVVGKTYKVTLRARRGTGSTTLVARAKTSIGGNLTAALPIAQTTSMTTTTFYFVATTTSSRLDIYDNSASSAGGTFYLDDISIKSIAGRHALQATAGSRPTYQTSGGLHWLAFDGTDDHLLTSAIDLTGTDKSTMFAAVRKNSDAARATVANIGDLGRGVLMQAPHANAATSFAYRQTLTAGVEAPATGYAAPTTAVVGGMADGAADYVRTYIAGVQVAQNTADQGAGALPNSPLYIGARSTVAAFLNGNIYGLVLRGSLSTAAEIARMTAYYNKRAGL